MKRIVFFEIDVPYCSLVYGVAPCEAALGVTGELKCFNTLATCQDVEHYTRDHFVTLRFTKDSGLAREAGIEAYPCMISHSFTPGTISLGEDLGTRSSLSVRFRDMKHTDAGPGMDKYWQERGWNAYERGTFWGRFRARQPYIKGVPCRLIMGEVGQTLEEMETRHFIVESFSGPSVSGDFTISCRDILKMLDGDRAQAPRVSPGYLQGDISASATSASLTPAGVGDEAYPTSGLMAIGGKEIVQFTRSGNSLTLVRGREGTEPQELKAQDRCQLVLKYTAQDAAVIVRDLMVNYAGVPSSYIDLEAWQEETAANLQTVYTRTIPEPTPVATLVTDLIRSAALAIWWDDINRLVQFRVLKAIAGEKVIDERVQQRGSLSYRDQPNKRMSEIWTYFGLRNPLRPTTDPDNYLSVERRINSRAASNYAEDAIEKRYCPWIPQLARQTADRLNILTLGRFENPPRIISGSIYRDGLGNNERFLLGDGVMITDRFLQDATGALEQYPAQLTRINPLEDRLEFEAEEARWVVLEEIDLTQRIITIDTNLRNINLRSIHDQIYPPLREGDTVTFLITLGVRITSSSTGRPSLEVGSWPSWLEPTLRLAGKIYGAGGKGGDGGVYIESTQYRGRPGQAGGTALRTRHPIRIEFQSGNLIGGGGGGGGGASSGTVPGGGGGGGAGQVVGPGGAKGRSVRNNYARDGSPGTATNGGAGGQGYDNQSRLRGGNGGNLGQPGASGGPAFFNDGYRPPGGAAGRAIDGNSYVTLIGSGDIRGPRVN